MRGSCEPPPAPPHTAPSPSQLQSICSPTQGPQATSLYQPGTPTQPSSPGFTLEGPWDPSDGHLPCFLEAQPVPARPALWFGLCSCQQPLGPPHPQEKRAPSSVLCLPSTKPHSLPAASLPSHPLIHGNWEGLPKQCLWELRAGTRDTAAREDILIPFLRLHRCPPGPGTIPSHLDGCKCSQGLSPVTSHAPPATSAPRARADAALPHSQPTGAACSQGSGSPQQAPQGQPCRGPAILTRHPLVPDHRHVGLQASL